MNCKKDDIKNADKYISSLKYNIKNCIKNKKIDEALLLVESCARLLYVTNQIYIDEELEEILLGVLKEIKLEVNISDGDCRKIIFYDGFGLENRGLARIYLRALIKSGYYVIYITLEQNKGKIGLLLSELEHGEYECHYLKSSTPIFAIKELNAIFCKSGAYTAFLYTTPFDVVGVTVFRAWEKLIKRYLINLTDHAFWLGKYSFDICIEFRDYGACISKYKRKIEEEKLVCLPFYPIVDKNLQFQGYPFNKAGRKVIFSGGALYKTLGADNVYYEIVEKILEQNKEVVFWYAGAGDSTELQKVMKKYPNRCFHTEERRDFLEVLKHCDLYLGTYPISGGLMTQFSALAGVPPIQLWFDDDNLGMLIKQETLGILYKSKNQLLQRVNELILDGIAEEYKEQLKNSVIKEEDFTTNLNEIVKQGKTNYSLNTRNDVDTTKMLNTYRERFKFTDVEDCIVVRKNLKIWYMYPSMFMSAIIRKIVKKMYAFVKNK